MSVQSERLGLATQQELKNMERGEKYYRYLYDLETVYIDVIKELNEVTPLGGIWEVAQTGGMCCILAVHLVGDCDGVTGEYEFAVCPEGNLHIDDDVKNQEYLVGWSFYEEETDYEDEGECIYGVKLSELASKVAEVMKSKGVI